MTLPALSRPAMVLWLSLFFVWAGAGLAGAGTASSRDVQPGVSAADRAPLPDQWQADHQQRTGRQQAGDPQQLSGEPKVADPQRRSWQQQWTGEPQAAGPQQLSGQQQTADPQQLSGQQQAADPRQRSGQPQVADPQQKSGQNLATGEGGTDSSSGVENRGGNGSLASQFAREIDSIGRLVQGEGLFRLGFLILAGFGLAYGLRVLARRLTSRGLDIGGLLTRVSILAVTLIAVATTLLVLRRILRLAPLIAVVLLFVLLVAFIFANIGFLQNLLVGAGMALRGQVRLGVLIKVDGHEGVVTQLGPTAVGIRTSSGDTLFIPNRYFQSAPFSVRSLHRTTSMTVRANLGRPVSVDMRTRVRTAALLCPYRDQASDVLVQAEGTNGEVLAVSFDAPSEELARRARTFMQQTLEGMMAGPGDPVRGGDDALTGEHNL